MAEKPAIIGPQTLSSPRGQREWEDAARSLLDEGQNFLAHDVCRDGLRQFPDSFNLAIYGAIALSQTGAVDEARRLLAPVLDAILIDEGPFRRLQTALKSAVATLDAPDPGAALGSIAELAEAIEMVRGKKLVASADSPTYNALAHVFREAWLSSGERRDLVHCRELFLRAFHAGANPRDGVDAAMMAALLRDRRQARDLAGEVVALLADAPSVAAGPAVDERYRILATLGEAQLLLGDGAAALSTFQAAHALEGVHYGQVVSTLKEIELLRQSGVAIPDELGDFIKPPTVVVFTGHALDRDGEGPHFPPGLEAAVRAEIAQQLEDLNAQIGYCMASCGSELLFIEAMLERGAEVNVVMPFAIEDFIAEDVRYGGPRWEMRFRNALKLAASVTYATEERYLGHDMLYRFANQCLHGLATLRAGFLHTSPYLLAVWDMMPGSLVGGAGDFIDQWEDITRLRIVDLDGLLQQRPDLIGEEGPALPNLDFGGDEEEGQGRVIRSMLFCDIAGYSKLKEENIPAFLEFLGRLKEGLAEAGVQPAHINTWGDAIFAVMDKATPMAEYALTLGEVVARLGVEMLDKLPNPLNLRISLHAGPVFEAIDPIRGNTNFYGSHINRAARLEPVTVIGHVYATQQFVAVLTAEQSALRSEAVNNGEEYVERYACEYVGVLSLAKDFGKQTVYHLRRRTEIDHAQPEPEPEPEPEPLPEPEPVIDAAVEEHPAPSAASMLNAVAGMVTPGESAPARGRRKKTRDAPADSAAAADAAGLILDGDGPLWPGA
ncbi:adenylate/guanylate cyclase domain-containing protein [Magnetospirillum sp. UT-4]|uniref:adenylate/guanylate cyclase domain-containing protein n=1 Tax=Magnetospirillum sp. UT-4 TaxID=2681467 RepID=UPI0013830C0A|nr:adenylate/guanylate cyclase domain-containing protein [Magnetospirillum sp. UT-4]CAA7613896.1 putative Adenylate cyclase [Magnetospirillum sp. UT-4]